MNNTPKLFISYSWSSPEHEQWVIDLATQLRESGVDVILDKWDLKEGHDSIHFMEKMVTDPAVAKVAVISDKTYAEKANGRSGGVGTETQIISREVYEKQDQEKFVAILPIKDENGHPYLPTYYKSRIYIDLSETERYSDNFEKLLRWVFNKPLHVKPELGKAPSFINEGTAISLGTSAAQRRLLDALRTGKSYALGALDEYLKLFAANLEKFRITLDGVTENFDETVVDNIEKFTAYRNEFIQVVIAISQYLFTQEAAQKLHRFFEKIYPYMNRTEDIKQWNRIQFDNFKFIVHELYLYTISILIKEEHFNLAAKLISTPYYIQWHSQSEKPETLSFTAFHIPMESLELRKNRLNRLSSRADLLKKRTETTDIDLKSLMQTDFILFLRADIEKANYQRWWPETLLFARHSYGPFEVFARSQSKAYFDKAKVLLGINAPEDIKELMNAYRTGKEYVPEWQFERIDPTVLIGLEQLATKP